VSSWKHRVASPIAANAVDATQKSAAIGELLMDLVRENLKGLLAGAALLQDMVWMRKQTAAEVGTLLGITHDKTVRMLEALSESSKES
jgi:hypothetical protein